MPAKLGPEHFPPKNCVECNKPLKRKVVGRTQRPETKREYAARDCCSVKCAMLQRSKREKGFGTYIVSTDPLDVFNLTIR